MSQQLVRYLSRTVMLSLLIPLGGSIGACDETRSYGDRVRESVEISDHFVFGTPEKVVGATILIRDFENRVINANVSTKALEPDHAYSIWWAVYNYPQYCIVPYQCSCADLEIFDGDPRIKASVFWAGGLTADGNGSADTSLVLLPGRTTRPLFADSKEFGLRNFGGAELHVVLRTHGLAGLWGTVAEQISRPGESCPPQDCENVFASFHPPRD